MTSEEVYDLARKQYTDPVVVRLGDEYILGYWVLKQEVVTSVPLVFDTGRQGVVVAHRSSDSWRDLAKKAGLVPTKKRKSP